MNTYHFRICYSPRKKQPREAMPRTSERGRTLWEAYRKVKEQFPKAALINDGWEKDGVAQLMPKTASASSPR